MTTFDSIFQALQARPLPPLFPTQPWQRDVSQQVLDASSDSSPSMSTHLDSQRIGLLLLNDDLEAAHPLSQNMENATGSFWHAIIHRREGDFNNSLYWFRQTGKHPAFPAIHQAALEVLRDQTDEDARRFADLLEQKQAWQPEAFVACCREAKQSATDDAWLCRAQLAETQTLLEWCRASTA